MTELKILAVDLGTKCGIAHNCGGAIVADTYHLSTAAEVTAWGKTRLTRRCDPRISRLQKILCGIPKPDVAVFEDVQFSSYTLQCQLWSSLRTVLWLTLGNSCVLECVPVSTLKLFATGHGGATKEMMQRALVKKHPEVYNPSLDDNAIDALWILKWAQSNLARMPRKP